jgi:hypothetical protein
MFSSLLVDIGIQSQEFDALVDLTGLSDISRGAGPWSGHLTSFATITKACCGFVKRQPFKPVLYQPQPWEEM